jgi:hypothetical protein
MKKNLTLCPSCSGKLKISQYHCSSCGININGEFEGCIFCDLTDEDRYLALVFLQTGGNIRDVERVMGISYPTIKAKLAQLLEHLGVSPEEANGGRIFGDEGEETHHGKFVDHEEIRRFKRELKEKIHGHVHHSIRHAMKAAFAPSDENLQPDEKSSEATGKQDADIKALLNDIKEGKTDVASALKNLRGEKKEGESA